MQLLNINFHKQNYDRKAKRRKYLFSWYFLLFAALIFCIFWRGIHRIYGFLAYPDEFGYWVSAAAFNGYDWSAVMATSSMYYSFGYSLLLTPILRFSADSVQAYRIAVAVNMLLQCISIGLLWGILTRLYESLHHAAEFPEEDDGRKMKLLTAVGVAALYPVWTFYMQTTLAEALLYFLYLFICWQFIRFLEKPGMAGALILAFSLAWLYFVHMRTVGVVIALLLTLLIYGWKNRNVRKDVLTCIVFFALGMGIGLWLQGMIKESAYAAADAARIARNSYAGHINQVKEIFTITGMIRLLQSCEGKLYYLGMSSFGLFYPAAGFCMTRMLQTFRSVFTKENCFFFFLALSMLGQFMITAIATGDSKGLDFMLCGRYNEYLLPIFMGIGMLIMLECGCLVRIFLINAGISTALFIPVLWIGLHNGSDKMVGIHAAGLNYLSNERLGYKVIPEFIKAYAFGILLMLILTVCIVVGTRFQKDIFIMCALLFMETLLALRLSQKYIYYGNDLAYYNLRIYEYIEDYEEKNKDKNMEVYCLHNGRKGAYIGLFQFALKEKSIVIVNEKYDEDGQPDWSVLEPVLGKESFLLVDKSSKYLHELEENYEECVKANHYVLFLIEQKGIDGNDGNK